MISIRSQSRVVAAAGLLIALAVANLLPGVAAADATSSDSQDAEAGAVVLSGYTAKLSGPPVRRERERLTHWHSAKSIACWSIRVDQPCLVEVQVESAVQAPFAGSPYRVSIGAVSFSGSMQDTGAWDSFQVFSLGKAEVAEGEHVVQLQPTDLPNGVFGNIRSVRLVGKHIGRGHGGAPDTSGPIKVFTQ